MDKFVDKFNIFDLFTMLIPGIVISILFSISLSFKYYDTWSKWGNEKYVIFFIFSYFFGVIFQELGTILDKQFLWKVLYGGNPREVFLLEDNELLNNKLEYDDAIKIKNYIIKSFNIDENKNNDKKIFNSYIFAYCLNMSEMNNLTSKSDKMFVISEMSRSLFWGCACTVFFNCIMVFQCWLHWKFYLIESILLIFIGIIFLERKKRYEKYRIDILLRALIIYLTEKDKLKG